MKENAAHTDGAAPPRRVRVWDLPVRIFHWALVLLFCFSWWSGKEGGNAMQYHLWSGYAMLTLVLFRLAWGFVGSSSARFAAIVRAPRAVMAYLHALRQRQAPGYLGYNPVGGWSVLLMLSSLALQTGTGLFANDDIATEGPLYKWVSKATSDFLSAIHYYNFYVLLVLAGLHVAAVLYYLSYRSDNLVKPMFTGYKLRPPGHADPPVRFASTSLAVVVLAIAAAAVYLLVRK